MQRFADRAPFMKFFNKYETIYKKDIQRDLISKEKREKREARIAAGETVSDTSSTKERKKFEKDEML